MTNKAPFERLTSSIRFRGEIVCNSPIVIQLIINAI